MRYDFYGSAFFFNYCKKKTTTLRSTHFFWTIFDEPRVKCLTIPRGQKCLGHFASDFYSFYFDENVWKAFYRTYKGLILIISVSTSPRLFSTEIQHENQVKNNKVPVFEVNFLVFLHTS